MPLFSDRGLQCVAPAEIIGLECFSPCRFGAIVAASLITSCLARDWQDDVRSILRLPRSRCSDVLLFRFIMLVEETLVGYGLNGEKT